MASQIAKEKICQKNSSEISMQDVQHANKGFQFLSLFVMPQVSLPKESF